MSRNILCIGAHPDDNEVSVGGTAAAFRKRGDAVKFVSVTDGSKGHYLPKYISDPEALANRRVEETLTAAAVIGAEYETMGIPDGEVYVTPANTEEMIRLIRSFGPPGQGPDLILLNRPTDYHRDHRYTSQLVLDATYMLTVPPMCPDTPHLERMPVFAYWQDNFTEGDSFRAEIVVPIDDVMEQKIDMICAHASQFFEWLPYNAGTLSTFPDSPEEKRALIGSKYKSKAAVLRERYSALVDELSLGNPQYVEAFQISEYGRKPERDELIDLFRITP
jgi:LmbE family N-acetylglucosaminyl deacetylase